LAASPASNERKNPAGGMSRRRPRPRAAREWRTGPNGGLLEILLPGM